jgi:multidrug efflux pump subunit AcrB
MRRDEDFDAPALNFGILVSTVLTLVVIPVPYHVVCRVRRGA